MKTAGRFSLVPSISSRDVERQLALRRNVDGGNSGRPAYHPVYDRRHKGSPVLIHAPRASNCVRLRQVPVTRVPERRAEGPSRCPSTTWWVVDRSALSTTRVVTGAIQIRPICSGFSQNSVSAGRIRTTG